MSRRYPQLTSVSVHPGSVSTDLIHNSTLLARVYAYGHNWLKGIRIIPPAMGALSELWAAAGAKKDRLANGAYSIPVGRRGELDEDSANEEFRAKVWDWTEQVLDAVG
jgi:hypothetical protein